MKILFICGSLELGRDGVGDYVRRLAGEVTRHGHDVSAIALNEKQLQSEAIEQQISGESILQVLRIPDAWPKSKRFNSVKNWANNFNPEWVSFHFVPYSYNKKGLSFELGKQLRKACVDVNWQIMFHEVWIGKDKNSDWKRIFVSGLQKLLVKKMISDLAPKVIHTHLPVFYSKITKLGFNVKELPLYSNIEVVKKTTDNDPGIFRVGFFSQVDTSEYVMDFLNILAEKVLNKGLRFELLLIGGNEKKMKAFGDIFETLENLKSPVKYTGFIDDDEVSAVIQTCTIGITSTPRHALGKGSSVATLIGHGLPVAAPNIHISYNPDEIGFFSQSQCAAIITEPDFDQIATAKTAALLAAERMKLPEITAAFLSDLNTSLI